VTGRRNRRFWELLDFSAGSGLEIGPLHRPTVLRDQADVHYVDVFATEQLREIYVNDPSVSTERIPDVDFVLSGPDGVRTLAEATAGAAPFDWVIASHVVEHVPDLIGWLAQVAEVTADGGALVLAVPDHRYSFDLHRPQTTVGQMLHAHELGDVRPSTRAIYDHNRSILRVDTSSLWAGAPYPGYAARRLSLDQTLAKIERGRRGEYVDTHVWIFTPDSFLEQMAELRRLGLCPWYCEKLTPTRKNDLEFMVLLRRLPRDADPSDAPEAELIGNSDLPGWLSAQAEARIETRQLRRELRQLRQQLERAHGALATHQARVRDMEQSRQWRVGGALLAPVRALRRVRNRLRRLSRTTPPPSS
jgi:hypothetical protein